MFYSNLFLSTLENAIDRPTFEVIMALKVISKITERTQLSRLFLVKWDIFLDSVEK